jgi:hypothetical protein
VTVEATLAKDAVHNVLVPKADPLLSASVLPIGRAGTLMTRSWRVGLAAGRHPLICWLNGGSAPDARSTQICAEVSHLTQRSHHVSSGLDVPLQPFRRGGIREVEGIQVVPVVTLPSNLPLFGSDPEQSITG